MSLRQAIADAIAKMPGAASTVIRKIDLRSDGSGTIEYNPDGLFVKAGTPGFRGTIADIHDEEMVRAYLLARLVTEYGYRASPQIIEVEREYKPVGRPIGKGGRVDIFVRRPAMKATPSECFLFIECKAPDCFDKQYREMIDGQLFRLSRQEEPRPKYLVYFTVDFNGNQLRERLVLIDTVAFTTFDVWDAAGQPVTDTIPRRYGRPKKRRYANVEQETEDHRPLDKTATKETFNALQRVLHDVIWGGGGTNSNEVFVYITKLILCKIYDEKETTPKSDYQFQRLGDAVEPEAPADLLVRMNAIYAKAEETYLALPHATRGPAFEAGRIPSEKIAYVVGRIEGISVTENNHTGDILGEFFEQIVASDFTQTKGQFFTPIVLVRFILEMADIIGRADVAIRHGRDEQGRPVLPYVIDSSCGSGTILIEYMKRVTASLGTPEVLHSLAPNRKDFHRAWFNQHARNHWAREFLFGIENNYDLGLAAKVNMVLHGDGSMNTWIKSALLPFKSYFVERRNNVLGMASASREHPYQGLRNEQFDMVLSNPPFSIKMSEDERNAIGQTFVETGTVASENLFIERWYQLLKEGGTFCCVLPEAVLDTPSNEKIRLFLMQHFRVRAVISLPYDAFRPFTSTKTSIVLAEKRPASEVAAWTATWARVGKALRGSPTTAVFSRAVSELGWADVPIFMAEPKQIGYKRRKNLADLETSNDLYVSTADGIPERQWDEKRPSVLGAFLRKGDPIISDPQMGFWTNLGNVGKRDGFRLDPKYRWMWDHQDGLICGKVAKAVRLDSLLDLVELKKIPEGDLAEEAKLIDLEYVESRQAIVREDDVPTVDSVESTKVAFNGADLLISKLEPYLGKIIIRPPAGAIGSTEWIGLKVKNGLPLSLAAYLLMLPETCEALRRLQAGKRHARLQPHEMLELRIELPPREEWGKINEQIERLRENQLKARVRVRDMRAQIDAIFEAIRSIHVKPRIDPTVI